MNHILTLILSLFGLWFGSELTIKGATSIARRFNISKSFIGLTILSVGTSIPEISVSIAGGIDHLYGIDTSGIVVGNAVGSAANQLTLILGFVGLFGALKIRKETFWRDGAMLTGIILLLIFMGYDGTFSQIDGMILIVSYLAYLFVLTREEKIMVGGRKPEEHTALNILSLIGGILLILLTSDHAVQSGVELAKAWGVTQTFIGIFVIGLGTGLPEIIVSLTAIRKKEVEMSVGNLVGSNICDLLFSLGTGTVISGFTVPERVLTYDLPALLIITFAVFFMFRRGYKLSKKEAVILIFMYFAYLGIRLYLFN